MPNTILEKLQEKHPNAKGINDARNIAEAMACISGTGGRGANAIADHTWRIYGVMYMPNGATGQYYGGSYAPITPVDLSAPTDWTPPSGKGFFGWGESANATTPLSNPYYISQGKTLYAIWKESATVTYSANGGTGTIEPVTVFDGTVITLSDGTGLTAPEDKEFAGWGSTSLAEEADIESPYTVTEDVTLYAIWKDAE